MDLTKLNRKTTVQPALTARDWQLFSDMTGVNLVAQTLNEKLAELVNAEGSTPESVMKGMAPFMRTYSSFGATDSEPRWVLQDIIEAVYNL